MKNFQVGEQFRIVSDNTIFTIKKIEGSNIIGTILKNNQEVPTKAIDMSSFKAMIGRNELAPVSLHKGKKVNEEEEQTYYSHFQRPEVKAAEAEQANYKRIPPPDPNFDYEKGEWIDPAGGTHSNDEVDGAVMYEDETKEKYTNIGNDGEGNIICNCSECGAIGCLNYQCNCPDANLNEDLMNSLIGMGYGPGGRRTRPQSAATFKAGDRVIYDDMDGNRLKGTILDDGEVFKGDMSYTVKLDNGEQRWGHTHQFRKLNENKQMDNNKKLNEGTSHEIPSPKYMVNYKEQDVVTAIKEAFKNYEGTTCSKIAAVGDSQFYNVEVSMDVEDEGQDLEGKRFVLAQKMHKVRAELFADLSAILPVVGINMANYEFTKNEDKVKFNLTILMSATNQRDWVSGAYQQRDKKLSDKLDKVLTGDEPKSKKK